MFILLDESGDLGFDFKNKSPSNYFIITLLVCQTRDALADTRKSIYKTLQRKLNHNKKRIKNEVKGTSTTLSIKEYFFNKLSLRKDIKVYSIILNKKKLLSHISHIDQHRIYMKMSYLALKKVKISKNAPFVHIIVDRCKRGTQAADLSLTLRADLEKLLPLTSIVTVEQISSANDRGLQAVDLFFLWYLL